MKIKLFSVLMMLCAFVMYSNAHNFNNNVSSSPNHNSDQVASMVTDASGNTYVLQNLYYNIAGTTTSNSLSGVTGGTLATDLYSVMVIDIHNQITGAVTNFATIRIAGSAYQSGIHGAAISLGSNGQIYVTGDFYGQLTVPSTWFGGTLPLSSNAGSSDVFTFRFNSSGLVDAFNVQGGNGQEYGTAMAHSGTNVYVAGYYFAYNAATETTTFNNGSLISTAAAIANSKNNSFILNFNATLTLLTAFGWTTPSATSESITPRGIIAQTNNLWITGGFTGNVTLATGVSVTNSSSTYTRLFTARYCLTCSTPGYNYVSTEGAVPTFGTYRGSSGNAIYTEGGAMMVVGYVYDIGSATHSGGEDGILIRYAGALGTPSKAWDVHIGGGGNDEAMAITNDGGSYSIIGYCAQGSGTNTYRGYSSGTQTRAGVGGKNQVFVARYNTIGNPLWVKTGNSANAKGTAISNNPCYLSTGGNFTTQLDWEEGDVFGSASPTTNKLFCGTIGTRTFTVPTPTANPYPIPVSTTTSVVFGASGADFYAWSTNPSSIFNVSLSPASLPAATCTLNVTSGAPAGIFDVVVLGKFTVGSNVCNSRIVRKVNIYTPKTDGTEVATSIEDVDQPMFTFNTFPNPTTNKLTISYSLIENAPATLQAVDAIGRVVFEKQVSAQYADETIDTDMWGNGAYIVSLQQNGKVVASKNVLKQ